MKKRLNLEKDDEEVYICKERLQWFHPIYLPQDSKLRKNVHVRPLFCIASSVIRNCYGCGKFESLTYHPTKQGPLPKDRTQKYFTFEVTCTDYACLVY